MERDIEQLEYLVARGQRSGVGMETVCGGCGNEKSIEEDGKGEVGAFSLYMCVKNLWPEWKSII